MGTAPTPAHSSGLEQNIAGLLCWLPIGPVPILASAFFLLAEPYKSDKFIRFHATQSIFAVISLLALAVGLLIINTIATVIFPPLDLLFKPLWGLWMIGVFALYIYMSVKAFRMESPKLPYIGELMTKYAGE